jgi:hypothetical protein
MNENIKLIATIIASLILYNYFVAQPAREILDDIFEEDSDNGEVGENMIAQTGNGTTVTALNETVLASGQDNQMKFPNAKSTVVLR